MSTWETLGTEFANSGRDVGIQEEAEDNEEFEEINY